jgi:glycosyltransferase involved in cell wall biosynthesis
MLKVAAFTGGENVPSARFRVRQHIAALRQYHGIVMNEFWPSLTCYPPEARLVRSLWAIASVAQRIPSIALSHSHDVTLLQRGFLSKYETLEFATKRPRVLDVDDSIHLIRNGRYARYLAGLCDLVICGNEYLSNVYANWAPRVALVPTAVDTARYSPNEEERSSSDIVIGWIGTSGNLKYVYQIEEALVKVVRQHRHVVVRIVCDKQPKFTSFPTNRMQYVEWSSISEVQNVREMDIGLMPLSETEWEWGKCSYKMLQYMACAVPVVVSPVGMNNKVLMSASVGFGASTLEQWVMYLNNLVESKSLRMEMGRNGRGVVLAQYSVNTVAAALSKNLFEISR